MVIQNYFAASLIQSTRCYSWENCHNDLILCKCHRLR